MRRWFTLLSLPALVLAGCQGAGAPVSVGTAHQPSATCSAAAGQSAASFSTAWVARGFGRRGGWGWGRGFYGGVGFRPVVPLAPVVTPIVTAPVVTTVATPIVNTVVSPTFAGAYGYFW